MSEHITATPIDDLEPAHPIPRHPFFDFDNEQASFIECIDAMDRVGSMIELCDFLKLDDNSGESLTANGAFGYYWVTVLMRGALSYVSDRLMVLSRQQQEEHQSKAVYLSALIRALPTLGSDNRDHFLNHTAAEMDITRSDLEQFICKEMK